MGMVAKTGPFSAAEETRDPHHQALDGQVERVGTRMSAAGVGWRDIGAGEAHE